jgi:type VI secretion system protein ImpL
LELHDRLKVDFPVYALFTKADLVAGFMEFFGGLGENGRKQVWGATFQTNDKTRNLVGEVPFEFDALIERLNIDLTDRLQEEPAPSTRVALFGFPAQMAALKRTIFDFLNSIFEPTRYHANATLRGFYFTSGTQEGTPIDQVIGALARSFGAEEVSGAQYSGKGRSFFLTDLINRVIKDSVESAERTKQAMADAVVEHTQKTLEETEKKVVETFKATLGSLAEDAASELVQQELEAMSKAASEMVETAKEKVSSMSSSIADLVKEFAGIELGRDTQKDQLNTFLSRLPKTNDVKG